MAKFKQSVLDKIKSDSDLFSVVAKEMKIKPTTLASNIDRNGNSLNKFSVVTAVANYLKVNPTELLESEKPVRSNKANAA